MEPPPGTSPDHDWAAQSFRGTRDELVLFGRTFAAILRGPKRFARAWAEGQRSALNPLAFFATSLAFVTPYRSILASLAGVHGSASIWANLGKPIAALVPIAWLAVAIHGALRLGGSKRRVAGTLGVVLYLAGAQGAVLSLLQWPVTLFMMAHPGAHALWLEGAGVLIAVLGIAYWVLLARALHGLHHVAWGWTLLGLVVGLAGLFPAATWLQLHHPALFLALMM